MDAVTILANGPADPERGWAGPLALFIAVGVCYAIYYFDDWWKGRRPPSPTADAAPRPREIPQVAAVSSHVSRDGTPVGVGVGADDGHWYGSIQKVGGTLRRVYRQAGHIARTGESSDVQAYGDDPGEVDVPDDIPDPEIDVPLDADHEGVGDEGGEPPFERNEAYERAAQTAPESREAYIARCLAAGVERPALVAALAEHYGRSRAQAYRDIDSAARRDRAA